MYIDYKHWKVDKKSIKLIRIRIDKNWLIQAGIGVK